MKTEHTPGPLSIWGVQEHTILEGFCMIGAEDKQTAHTAYVANMADARLYAAAPELLEACEEFCRKVESGQARSTKSYTQMKAAIEKAKGKSQ